MTNVFIKFKQILFLIMPFNGSAGLYPLYLGKFYNFFQKIRN